MKASAEELRRKIVEDGYPFIVVVRDDMATVLVKPENGAAWDLGVLGYAIGWDYGLAWIRDDGGSYTVSTLDSEWVKKTTCYYLHRSIDREGKGIKLSEVVKSG